MKTNTKTENKAVNSQAKSLSNELVKNMPATDESLSQELNYSLNYTLAFKERFSKNWVLNTISALKALRACKVADLENTFFSELSQVTNSHAQIVHLIGVVHYLSDKELIDNLGFTKSIITFLRNEKIVERVASERKSLKSWVLLNEAKEPKKHNFKTEHLHRAVRVLVDSNTRAKNK